MLDTVTSNYADGVLTVDVKGKIDSSNAQDIAKAILVLVEKHKPLTFIFDCKNIDYLSSAGLRTTLRIAKQVKNFKAINVSSDVYDVFEMTGFTKMLDIRRIPKTLSVEGCKVIGRGAKGIIYRIDDDAIVKVYKGSENLEDIYREQTLAREAFVAGVPTAISYTVVRVGDSYGSVFELLDASTLMDLLSSGVLSVKDVAERSVELLEEIRDCQANLTLMPDTRLEGASWLRDIAPYMDAAKMARLQELFDEIPEDLHIVHGDFHIGNIMVQDDECLLIDMDTLSHGDAIFELVPIYNAYVGYGLMDPKHVEAFLNIPYSVTCELWDLILRGYYPEAGEEELKVIEDKVRLLAMARLMGRPVRKGDTESDAARATFDFFRPRIEELLDKVDSLLL